LICNHVRATANAAYAGIETASKPILTPVERASSSAQRSEIAARAAAVTALLFVEQAQL
jgi:hypothetical protein